MSISDKEIIDTIILYDSTKKLLKEIREKLINMLEGKITECEDNE